MSRYPGMCFFSFHISHQFKTLTAKYRDHYCKHTHQHFCLNLFSIKFHTSFSLSRPGKFTSTVHFFSLPGTFTSSVQLFQHITAALSCKSNYIFVSECKIFWFRYRESIGESNWIDLCLGVCSNSAWSLSYETFGPGFCQIWATTVDEVFPRVLLGSH